MKNILITRPKNQAKEIAQFLDNQGFQTFIEPLFSLEKLAVNKVVAPIISQISAILITSANACEAVLDSDLPKNIKIFAVGKKTAQKLIENGFNNIVFPQENSAVSLKELIIETHKDKSGLILYFQGSNITLDFKSELEKFDFKVQNILSYRTFEMESFSADFLQFSKQNSFNYVLLFSQNNAKTFFKLVKKHNLLEYFATSRILCLSEKILADVKNIGFKNSTTFGEIPILKKFYD